MKNKINIAAATLGQRGGRATKAKLGSDFFRYIGAKGGKRKALKSKKLSTATSY